MNIQLGIEVFLVIFFGWLGYCFLQDLGIFHRPPSQDEINRALHKKITELESKLHKHIK